MRPHRVWDIAGHLTQVDAIKRGDGVEKLLRRAQFHRDPLGRVLMKQNADGYTRFDYDPTGRLTGARNQDIALNWEYDPAGRVVAERQGDYELQHRHDAVGRRTATILPDGSRIEHGFDTAGGLAKVKHNGETLLRIKRDKTGREMARRFGNAVETASLFDEQGRLLGQKTSLFERQDDPKKLFELFTSEAMGERIRPKRIINERLYTFDDAGRIASINDSRRGRTNYHYDAIDRLTQVQGPVPEAFVHDPAANILGVAEDKDTAEQQARSAQVEGNRLRFQGDTHFEYDEHGNRTAAHRGRDRRLTTRYHYNADDQLVAVETDKGTTQYAYDPLGRRISKENAAGKTRFYWDGDQLLEELRETPEGESTHHSRYLFEPASFRPLALIQNGQTYYYHLGTPLELTDARGNIAWAVTYRAYGSVAIKHEAQIEQPIRFQGQYFDPETGLHYNRFRYYDPICGQFVCQDPVGLNGGINLYRYAPNPVHWIDPLGLTCKEIEELKDRSEAAIERHGGVKVDGGYMFPSKKAARRAAAETLGDMGSEPVTLRMGTYGEIGRLRNPYKDTKKLHPYGLRSTDGTKQLRDDFLGHPKFGENRAHYNVEAWSSADRIGKPDVNLHYFYPKSETVLSHQKP